MTEIFARVRDRAVSEPESGDPWDAATRMFQHIIDRLAALEARRAAAHGRDGVGIVDARIDGSGHLLIEFSDGVVKDVGQVVGKDAPPAPAAKSLEFVRDDTGRIVSSVLK